MDSSIRSCSTSILLCINKQICLRPQWWKPPCRLQSRSGIWCNKYLLLQQAGNYIEEITQDTYFKRLFALEDFIKDFKPELILWLQGADIWKQSAKSLKDKGLTSEEIAERDRYVIDTIMKKGVPFVMSPAGGYIQYKDESGNLYSPDIITQRWNDLLKIYLFPINYYNKNYAQP